MTIKDSLGRERKQWSLREVEAFAEAPDNVVGVMDVHTAQDLARFAMRAVELMLMVDDREHPDVAAFMSEGRSP